MQKIIFYGDLIQCSISVLLIILSKSIDLGDNCENETDACLESPCSLDRECTDLSPEEESVLGRGFNCSACPPGYDEIDDDCFGKIL